ncbi:MAG: DUF3095 domain-containing protein [Candidatus Protistobacter heckmanni]|nr:DUF3095 domain-containing protein [Candidatus Protistobacter heckmanni]
MTDSSDFYKDLPVFKQVAQIGDARQYREVPGDWMAFLTDVRSSTQAILDGRYKQVNTVGMAAIIAAHNAYGNLDFPYVFTGDGATLLAPASHKDRLRDALLFIKARTREEFGLELRIAAVPVARVRELGGRILVAKQELSPGVSIAMFSGDGIAIATRLMKEEEASYDLALGAEDSQGDVEGLECRWNAIHAERDGMLTLIIRSVSDDLGDYSGIIEEIHAIVPKPKPVKPSNLPVKWSLQFLWNEIKLKTSDWALQISLTLLIGLFTILVRKYRHKKGSAAEVYISEMSVNTDFLKLDDFLKMVIDVLNEQKALIEALFERKREEGKIVYGAHLSSHALMTCFIKSEGKHVHFIDGGDGGYVLAAKHLRNSSQAEYGMRG